MQLRRDLLYRCHWLLEGGNFLRNSSPKQPDLFKEGSQPIGGTSETLTVQPNSKGCNSKNFLTVSLIHDLTQAPESNQK